MKYLKKLLLSFLILSVFWTSSFTVCAENSSKEYLFELSVDGSVTKTVQTGDVITVVFNLKRTDSADDYQIYGMQNEIRYDSNFFELVEGSALLSSGINTADIGLLNNYREFYMNYVTFSGEKDWEANKLIGSFQLKVIADSGVTKITNQDYLMSTSDGKDHYKATCQDVTIILSTDCTVTFVTNGGSEIPSQTVMYGEYAERPDAPVREGYEFVGWFSDIDMQKPWDFENDKVEGNLTLYAKWQKEGSVPAVAPEVTDDTDSTGGMSSLVWLLGLLLLGLIVLLALLLGKKTVKFETGTDTEIKSQKIRKGGYVKRPEEPKRVGRIFAGWYKNEECTKRWDFEDDKVQDNMTLYAKWI